MSLFHKKTDDYGIIEEDREQHPDTGVEMLIQIRDLLRATNTSLAIIIFLASGMFFHIWLG